MEPKRRRVPRMREVVFHVLAERPDHLEVRVRVHRVPSAAVSSIRPMGRPAALRR
jgi:hypothetical protein